MSNINQKHHNLKNGKSILIRSARKSDAAQMLTLGRSVMSERIYTMTEADELDLTLEQEEKWIQDYTDHPSKIILVADIEGQIVGIINFLNGHRRRIAHHGEFGMSVASSWREVGVGAALLSSLIEWAETNPSIEKINLKVHSTNQRAINLYRKYGFVEEGYQKRDLKLGPSEYLDSLLMGRFVK